MAARQDAPNDPAARVAERDEDAEAVGVTHQGPITRVTLNRPDRRNALSLALMETVTATLRSLPEHCALVILDAEGPVFSAGHDLSEMVAHDRRYYEGLFEACTEMMLAVHSIPQPVIAKVQGGATAAGCQLVASCDLAVASDDAWFATPGVKIGLFCSTPMVPVVRVVGRRRALQMLLTGEPVNARTALEWGLVNNVVSAADLEQTVQDLAATILCFSPTVIGMGKRAFYAQVDLDEVSAYGHGMSVMVANAVEADAQEGMRAFLEKRAPQWNQR